MKIMLADDEESIRIVVEYIITEDGYDFCYAADGAEALAVFEAENPDLVILDVMMPKLNGFDVCAQLRKKGSNVPIIILSAKGDIVDKSVGFKAGADDYLVKPFSSLELSLRIEALLRRRDHQAGETEERESIKLGDLEIFFKRYEARLKGKRVELTPKEFKILAYMASHPGKVYTRKQLLTYVWGEDYVGELTGIAVFICKIREKIEEDPSKPKYLQTVWGVGYKFGEKE
ncbi:two component transcriptional regulator, winged helix family [Desulfitobacterium hafniense DCB-2]|uniref:Stage 0 sporulation protein A homolog n=2 Tax=Desulfitobacterium hafniense TaxID=49338 RepID=A0A0W1JQK5_DESHA|nr:response regulator transcription factor [Desulfitobacterium hafniense]ACL22684.1 two component transcriptional regulator, winged helix family [Desulfitobacterium hafniense DCB-2]KTE93654.1 two-component system response regulator [Desulfitobacterium hafniense]